MARANVTPSCCCLVAQINFFDMPDGTNIGEDFTEEVGDWFIVSGRLSVASAGAITKLLPTTTEGYNRIKVIVACNAVGNAARILFDYIDENNFLFVEVQSGNDTAGLFRVVRKTAGADSVIYTKTMFIGAGERSLEVCYDSDGKLFVFYTSLSLSGSGGNTPSQPHAVCMLTGQTVSTGVVALGTGAVASSAVKFQSFVLERRDVADCTPCPMTDCPACTPNGTHNIPNEMQVNVTGVTKAGEFDCAECPTLMNATFITKASGISVTNENIPPSLRPCYWQLPIDICNYKHVFVFVEPWFKQWRITAIMKHVNGTEAAAHKDQSEKFACTSLSDIELGDIPGGQTNCDFSNALFTVTAA